MNQGVVESALDTLRPALAADNFALHLVSVTANGTVQVILEAQPDACLDCLVPEHMLVMIIETAIRKAGGALDHVELVREGFGTAVDH
jgi:Fe-S cluster biogenesis protein NfuA